MANNYYTQFEAFKKKYKIQTKDEIPIETFKGYLMLFFGFSIKTHHGTRTVDTWVDNFQKVGFIKLTKIKNSFDSDDNWSDNWMVTIL